MGAGGGRKIIRCEISLDSGKSWRLADIQRFAPPNPHGKHWAWVFYSLPVSLGAQGHVRPARNLAAHFAQISCVLEPCVVRRVLCCLFC